MLILTQNLGLILGPILVSAGMSLFGSWFFIASFSLIPALFMTAVCSTYIFVAPEGLGMENGISQIIGFAITIVVLAFFLVWKKKTGNI